MKYWEPYLIGALDMVHAGMKPSDAVSVGATLEDEAGLARFLGVRSLRDLDTMPDIGLWRLLQPYALANV